MPGLDGSEGASEGSSSLDRRSRMSVLGTGTFREKRTKEGAVEKKGNTSKVPIEVEMLPGASESVQVSQVSMICYVSSSYLSDAV